eukprot:10538765-Prorocentrum_lima.AAC.1
MTSSLVGSEMCIRDSVLNMSRTAQVTLSILKGWGQLVSNMVQHRNGRTHLAQVELHSGATIDSFDALPRADGG